MTLVDTGEDTHDRRPPASGSRDYVATTSAFCFTYGDGVADVDIGAAIAFHRAHGKLATRHRGAAARPLRRARASTAPQVTGFSEKPRGDGGWINGGFFVLSPEVHRPHRRRRDQSGSASRSSGLARDGELIGVRAHRLLAADGHAARQDPARGAVAAGAAPWKTG